LGVLGRTGTCEQDILSKQMGGAGHKEQGATLSVLPWGSRSYPLSSDPALRAEEG
jgi:hypothetical protein